MHVLNLSFSFYHETPDDPTAISEIAELLRKLRDDHDVVVVCSAGNEATDRPTYPAALPNTGERHLSVGALNPADHSVALFSNIGDWVDVYAPGVSLVSTVPVDFDGGIQAGTRDDKNGRRRETLDVDDFRGGFGVWSGTSFAAPVVAGRIAAQIADGASSPERRDRGARRPRLAETTRDDVIQPASWAHDPLGRRAVSSRPSAPERRARTRPRAAFWLKRLSAPTTLTCARESRVRSRRS